MRIWWNLLDIGCDQKRYKVRPYLQFSCERSKQRFTFIKVALLVGGIIIKEIIQLEGRIKLYMAKSATGRKMRLKFHCNSNNKHRQQKLSYNAPNSIKKKNWQTCKPSHVFQALPCFFISSSGPFWRGHARNKFSFQDEPMRVKS